MHKKPILFILLLFILTLAIPPITKAQFPVYSDYAVFIQEQIYKNLVYPPEAFVKGLEGIVTVNFTIGQNGYLKDIFVAESSGYPSLDEGAVAAVKSASPYPLPEGHEGEDIELVVPLEFKMDVLDQPEAYEPPEEWLPQQEPPENESIEQSQVSENRVVEEAPKFLKKINEDPGSSEQASNDFKVVWPKELSGFIDIAIKNNKPSQVAKKEADLAEFKVKEAMRNLLPSLKLSSVGTKGETYHVPYEEGEVRVEFNQPIYYGGRLIDSIEHARINALIAQKNLDRIKFDIMHKTESAYYNLIASRTHWKYKEALRNEAQELLDRITKLADIGMIIPLEVKSARSSFEQIEFQLASLKQDIYLAELTFKQVLNSQDIPAIALEEPEIVKPDLNLEELFSVALKNRAEIQIGELMVKFNKYAKKLN